MLAKMGEEIVESFRAGVGFETGFHLADNVWFLPCVACGIGSFNEAITVQHECIPHGKRNLKSGVVNIITNAQRQTAGF